MTRLDTEQAAESMSLSLLGFNSERQDQIQTIGGLWRLLAGAL